MTLDLWRRYANCRDADPAIFYPEHGAPAKPARALCDSCMVRRACLEYALDAVERHGIWGGLTEEERRPIRGARRRGAVS